MIALPDKFKEGHILNEKEAKILSITYKREYNKFMWKQIKDKKVDPSKVDHYRTFDNFEPPFGERRGKISGPSGKLWQVLVKRAAWYLIQLEFHAIGDIPPAMWIDRNPLVADILARRGSEVEAFAALLWEKGRVPKYKPYVPVTVKKPPKRGFAKRKIEKPDHWGLLKPEGSSNG